LPIDHPVNDATLFGQIPLLRQNPLTYNDGFTDPALSPEMIRDRIDEVLDTSTAKVWTSASSRYEARAANG